MPDFTKRVVKGASSDLGPGEQVIRAVVAQPPGSITRGITETGSTAFGYRRGRKQKARHEAEVTGLAAQIPPQNVYLTLTDRRVLIHVMTKMGNPEQLVAQYRFDQIASIRCDPKRFKAGSLEVTFADETAVDLLVVQRQDPVSFVAEWDRASGRA
jgi:hypothetical protein